MIFGKQHWWYFGGWRHTCPTADEGKHGDESCHDNGSVRSAGLTDSQRAGTRPAAQRTQTDLQKNNNVSTDTSCEVTT